MAAVRVIACVLLTACVGGVEGNGGNGSGSGSGSAIDAAIDAPKLMWVDAAGGGNNGVPCKNPATPPGDGHHETGHNCFDSCHNHGFTVAGTLYTNSTGNTSFPGATITITDSNNQTINLVTMLNGNFYTTQPIAWPALVVASSCPSGVKMQAAVASTGRGCNVGGCHPGATDQQMHLP